MPLRRTLFPLGASIFLTGVAGYALRVVSALLLLKLLGDTSPSQRHMVAAYSLLWVVKTLPTTLFGSVFGLVIDRFDRKRLLIGLELSRFALCGGLAAVLWKGTLPLSLMVGWIATLSLLNSWGTPTIHALVPRLCSPEKRMGVNSFLSIGDGVSLVIGPGLGELGIDWLGLPGTLLVAGALYLGATLVWGTVVSTPPDAPDQRRHWAHDLHCGFVRVWRQKSLFQAGVASLFKGATLGLGGVAFPVLIGVMFAAPPERIGELWSIGGVGSLVGGVLVWRGLSGKGTPKRMMAVSFFLTGLILVAIPFCPTLLALAFLTAGANLIFVFWDAAFLTYVQGEVEPAMAGRVFLALHLIFSVGFMGAIALVWALHLGVVPILVMAGGLRVAGGLILFVAKPLASGGPGTCEAPVIPGCESEPV